MRPFKAWQVHEYVLFFSHTSYGQSLVRDPLKRIEIMKFIRDADKLRELDKDYYFSKEGD